MEIETSTETSPETSRTYHLEFSGNGPDYFSIMIVNWLLTLITFGLYYPWARAKRLRYIYEHTSLNNERFYFTGTGKEMFRGFIKIILLYFGILALYFLIFKIFESPGLAVLFLYLAIFAIFPFAIHGSFRYRMSRITYRGIRFGYRGNLKELVENFFKWVLFTVLSFGIYASWMQMNIRRYTHGNIRYGDVEFSNDADGTDWFVLNLKGYLITVFTFGIGYFYWESERFAYYINNMKMTKGDQSIYCSSSATTKDFFYLLAGNFLLTFFTLGFGKAWADMRTQKFKCDMIKMEGDINIDEINQTEEEYTNAFGDDAVDFFEIDMA